MKKSPYLYMTGCLIGIIFVLFGSSSGAAEPMVTLTADLVPAVPSLPPVPAIPTSLRTDGTLIRYDGSPMVYVLEGGKKRWVQTAEEFVKLGFSWDKVVLVSPAEIYPDGEVKALTPGRVTALFVHSLARGARGTEVSALQQKLKDLGFFPASVQVTPNFGPTTEGAVKAFQKANGLAQVGIAGPLTRALLNRM